jgi:FkbM family methyltransferase
MTFIEQMSKELLDVEVVLDIGSREGEDSVKLKELFPDAKIYAFECTPFSIKRWKDYVKNKDIILIEKAVCDFSGYTPFYVMNPDKCVTSHPNGNQGANSLYVSNPNYPLEKFGYNAEKRVQDRIIVPCVRLYDWVLQNNINKIDVIWMDIQGAELLALKGMGYDLLSTVRAIHLEVEFYEEYIGQPLFNDVDSFLKENGFDFVSFENSSALFADANYIRNTK